MGKPLCLLSSETEKYLGDFDTWIPANIEKVAFHEKQKPVSRDTKFENPVYLHQLFGSLGIHFCHGFPKKQRSKS